MSIKFRVFDWVPDWIREAILEQVPEDVTREQLQELADSLKTEISDMHFQLKSVSFQKKLDNLEDSEEYLDWKRRTTDRLRLKNTFHGVVLSNLRFYQDIEQKRVEAHIEKLKTRMDTLEEGLNKERLEKIENQLKHLSDQLDLRHQAIIRRFEAVQKQFDRVERQKSFIYRCLFYLLSTFQDKHDEEYLYLLQALSFVPPVREKTPVWGTWED